MRKHFNKIKLSLLFAGIAIITVITACSKVSSNGKAGAGDTDSVSKDTAAVVDSASADSVKADTLAVAKDTAK